MSGNVQLVTGLSGIIITLVTYLWLGYKIEILRCSAKNSVRRQMDAALGVLRLRPKSVPLEKVQAMQIIREIFTKKRVKYRKTINNY